jgi:O-antigen ligase
MSASLRLSMIVMLGAGGLFTGGVVWYAWERVWIWRRLSLSAYAVDFRRSVRKADPALPILLVTCGAAAAAFASLTGGAGRALALGGIVLLGVVLVSSLVLAEPINSQFRRRREGVVPPDAERLRRRWRRFHLVRTVLAVAAFVLFVTAVSYA